MELEVARLIERLRTAADAICERQPEIESRGPWPPATSFGTEPEASWGPPEVLAHVSEMLPFWLGEVERVLDGRADGEAFEGTATGEDGQAVPFGRVAGDQLRIGVIERDRSLPPRELFDRIRAAVGRYEQRLPQLTAAELAARGLHPTLGELTVAQIVERFAVAHLEEHDRQLAEILG